MKKGPDISKWQGNIDFNSVKKAGIDFLIIREGYRKKIDPMFLEYVREAKEKDLLILGVYHFMYSHSIEDAKMEAQSTISNIKKAGLDRIKNKIIIFSDFEYDTIMDASEYGITLRKNDCNDHVETFCSEIERLGYQPGIYTNLDFYKNYYTKDILSKYPIWLADYTNGPDFDCIVQQYTNQGSIPGISGNVDINYYYGNFKMNEDKEETVSPIKYSRQKVVDLATSWIGKNEKDGSYKEIIDIYNSYSPLPRGTKMQYEWSWCACTWSALAISLGYTDVMPIEISCGELINKAKDMGIWVEDDFYRPLPGDGILYDWDDNGNGDNQGWPDHIGVVSFVNGDQLAVIEGNKSDAVGVRAININGKYIRGYITPKFNDEESILETTKSVYEVALEVINGVWGNGISRKEALTNAGYDYNKVQSKVNEIINKKQKLYAACHIILGNYKKENIEELGLNYDEINELVNKIISIVKE